MVSLAACVLSVVGKVICKPERFFSHAFNLPFPQTLHKYIDSTYIDQYDEIFVIGDIHGCYDELISLLNKADVVKDSTLKIFVGDLINKGTQNHEVLNFLRESNSMLAVRGNHDEVVLREYFNAKDPGYELKSSNLWIKELSSENVEYLCQLPFSIHLAPLHAIVVHAGLLPGIALQDNDPSDMVSMRNIIVSDYFWEGGLKASKNTHEGEPWASLWSGPEHVYFGHDAKRMLQIYPYATGLDTGCVYGNCLTGVFIKGPRKGKFVKVNALKVHSQPKSRK